MYAQPRGQSVSTIVSDPSDFQLRWQNDSIPVAVIPCATVKQARQIVKWNSLSREGKQEAVEQAIREWHKSFGYKNQVAIEAVRQSRAILALTGATP